MYALTVRRLTHPRASKRKHPLLPRHTPFLRQCRGSDDTRRCQIDSIEGVHKQRIWFLASALYSIRYVDKVRAAFASLTRSGKWCAANNQPIGNAAEGTMTKEANDIDLQGVQITLFLAETVEISPTDLGSRP